jgi:hypothetical protein
MQQHLDNINKIIESGFKKVLVESKNGNASCIMGFNGGVLFVYVNLDDITVAQVNGYTLDEVEFVSIMPVHLRSHALKIRNTEEGMRAYDALYAEVNA